MSSIFVSTPQGMRSIIMPDKKNGGKKMVYDDIVLEALKTSIKVTDDKIVELESEITEQQKKRKELVEKINEITNGGK